MYIIRKEFRVVQMSDFDDNVWESIHIFLSLNKNNKEKEKLVTLLTLKLWDIHIAHIISSVLYSLYKMDYFLHFSKYLLSIYYVHSE